MRSARPRPTDGLNRHLGLFPTRSFTLRMSLKRGTDTDSASAAAGEVHWEGGTIADEARDADPNVTYTDASGTATNGSSSTDVNSVSPRPLIALGGRVVPQTCLSARSA